MKAEDLDIMCWLAWLDMTDEDTDLCPHALRWWTAWVVERLNVN